MVGVVWMSCISGSQMTLFGELLGFSNRDFGWLSAIAWAAYLGQLISAILIERTGLRKVQFLVFATVHRLIWLLIAAVPLVFGAGRGGVRAFLIIYAVGAVLAHMAMPPWQNWMGDLIPRRIRGRYFATRRTWATPVKIVVVVGAGLLLDAVTRDLPPGTPITMQTQPYLMPTICALFALGAIFGTVDVLFFLRMREIVSPPLVDRPRRPRRHPLVAAAKAVAEPFQAVVEAVRDRGFIFYALFGASVAFAMTVGAQFFWRNALRNLGYSKLGANVIFMVCGPVSALVVVRLWGRLIDVWGRRPVLMLCLIGTVFSPLPWFLVPTGSDKLWIAYAMGAASCLFGGAMWAGVQLGQFNVLLGFSDGRGRSKYIAAAAVFSAIGGFSGGVIGGFLADHFIHLQYDLNPIRVGPFLWNNWHLTFLLSMVARAAAFLWLIPMPDPGAKRFRDVVRHIRFNVYSNTLPRLFRRPLWRRTKNGSAAARPGWPWRLLRRRRRSRREAA